MNLIFAGGTAFVLQRAKAVMGAAAAAAVTAGLAAVSAQFGVQIPTSWSAMAAAFVVGIFVHNTPNAVKK